MNSGFGGFGFDEGRGPLQRGGRPSYNPGIEAAIHSVRALQSELSIPFLIETGVNYLRPLPEEVPDGEFVARVVEGSGCGILLDLHNLWANERNGRQSIADFLDSIPLERVRELHLASGHEHGGLWLDAHSGAMPEGLFELAQSVVRRLPNLGAVIFEEVQGVFSDACNKAIEFGKPVLMKDDWKRVFEPEEIAASIKRIT